MFDFLRSATAFLACYLVLLMPVARAEVPPLKAAVLDSMPFKFRAQVLTIHSDTISSNDCRTEIKFEVTAIKIKDMGIQQAPAEVKLSGSAFHFKSGCVGASGMRIFERIKRGDHILVYANSQAPDGSFFLSHYSEVELVPDKKTP